MRAWPSSLRAACLVAAGVVAGAFAMWWSAPRADATGPPSLDAGDVTSIVSRCVAYAKRAPGKPKLAIAVVDNEGNSLGVFRMAGLATDDLGTVDDAVAAALAKAGTASYFSSDDQTFTTRTAAFIIQDHFPPGVRFQPGGPLYGVEFSSFAGTDANRVFYPPFPTPRVAADPLSLVETRVRGDLGAVGLYKNRKRVGGLGIDDGDTDKRISIPARVLPGMPATAPSDCRADYRLTFSDLERGRVLEEIVLSAARGRLAPPDVRSDKILVGGIRLDFSRGTSLGPIKNVPTVVPGVDGSWDPDFTAMDAAPIASRFADATLLAPPAAAPDTQSFHGQFPVAVGNPPTPFDVHGSTSPDGPTKDEVLRILWQGARRASTTRGAIRRPIGSPMQCWIAVVDAGGELLGAYRTDSDTTLFSYDVAVQKARTAMFFSDESAAFSCRAVGLLSQGFYPAGQQSAGRGPLFQLQDGLTVALIGGVFGNPVAPAELGKIRNGLTIFPGGVPLYRGGRLIGGVGVSGDGVDQDDIVADFASRGFGPPAAIRCDNLSPGALKAALTRALDRITAAAPADPFVCDTLPNKILSFFHARLADAQLTLKRTELEVAPPYVKYPRHPGPVTIRR